MINPDPTPTTGSGIFIRASIFIRAGTVATTWTALMGRVPLLSPLIPLFPLFSLPPSFLPQKRGGEESECTCLGRGEV